MFFLSLKSIISTAGSKADSSLCSSPALAQSQRVAGRVGIRQVACSLSKGKWHGSSPLDYTDIFSCVFISHHTGWTDPVRLISHEQDDWCPTRGEGKGTWASLLILTRVFSWASGHQHLPCKLWFITNEDLLPTLLVHASSCPWKTWTNVNCFLFQFITQDAWQLLVLMNTTGAPGPCNAASLSPSWLTAHANTALMLWIQWSLLNRCNHKLPSI